MSVTVEVVLLCIAFLRHLIVVAKTGSDSFCETRITSFQNVTILIIFIVLPGGSSLVD